MTPTSTQEWPRLAWFLQSGLMGRIVLLISIAALTTEAFVLMFAGEPVLGYIGVALGASGVAVSRFRPLIGLVVVVAGAVAAALFATEFIALWSVVVLTLLSVTAGGARAVPAFLVSALPVYLAIVIRMDGNFRESTALIATACCAAAAAIGGAVCAQERYVGSMKQRALDAEAAAELAIERGVFEERLRIARDLHDAVGHEIAVVNMNIGVAEVRLHAEDTDARAALGAARAGVQRVLQETQQILDVLRRGQAGPGDAAPVPDIAQLTGLVEMMEAAGSPIVAQFGDLGNLSPSVSAAVFRIAQEALTNAQRYGIGTIQLSVIGDREHLVVDVRNARLPAAARALRGSGYGLIGMRERAESVGGVLEVFDEPDAFRVRAIVKRSGNGAA